MKNSLLFLFLTSVVVSCIQQPEELTIADYQRAESFLYGKRDHLVYGLVGSISWQNDGRLIFAKTDEDGEHYFLADLGSGNIGEFIDRNQFTEAFTAFENDVDPQDLGLYGFELEKSILTFRKGRKSYKLDLSSYEIEEMSNSGFTQRNSISSPDNKKAVYIKDYNLWLLDKESGKRTQLTFDGEKDYGYGTNNAGWLHRDSPVLLWSPNSDKIATFRHDGRGVGEMYLYNTRVGHSDLQQWKYPLPGDSLIFRIERIVIDVSGDKPNTTRLKMDQDPHRSTTSDHIAGRNGRFLDVAWNDDASVLSFVSSSRDHKVAHLRVADPKTGDVRSVLEEIQETYYEGGYSSENWRVLPKSNEVIWFSEKSDWGHLYLHDLGTGELKNQITEGDWAVLDVESIDEANRVVYFTGSNREEGDPYFHYLYKINLDGSGLTLLTPETANHSISWSDDYQHFVDTYSTPTTPPTTVVKDLTGKIVLELGSTDISTLIADGWVAPEPFQVKARDGETDIYGLLYKPSNFDPAKKYPILNYLYPGPQSGSVGSRSFRVARSDKQAVAELGFIVVELDAMGTPGRSKSFHDAYYANMGDNGLPDQIAGITQLAEDRAWMDIDKVGIWGHSGGGFASTAGILRYPDFYKVAVSSSGNHDNRNYEDDWGEKWHGLLIKNEGTPMEAGTEIDAEINLEPENDNYDKQANQLLANNLKGKLLLAHGLLDDNVPPTNTLLVAEALMKANKEFDMLMIPNARHGYGSFSRYFMKKRWNYFVEHLQGRKPLYEFEFSED